MLESGSRSAVDAADRPDGGHDRRRRRPVVGCDLRAPQRISSTRANSNATARARSQRDPGDGQGAPRSPCGGVLSRSAFRGHRATSRRGRLRSATRGRAGGRRSHRGVEPMSVRPTGFSAPSLERDERRPPLGEPSRDGGRRGEALRRRRGGGRRRPARELRRAGRGLPPGDGRAAGVRASSGASASRSGRPTDTNG